MVDLDEVFAYKTDKRVKILDRKLGILFYGIQVAVLLYIVVFVMIINKGYLGSELAIGQVRIDILGDGLMIMDESTVLPFDRFDMRAPPLENGAVFVILKDERVKQERGICGNPDFECSSDSDCPAFPGVSQQKCSGGLCEMAGWCPPIGTTEDTKTLTVNTQGTNITAWFRTMIQFPILHPGVIFTNMDSEKPVFETDLGQTDAWTLTELLSTIQLTMQDVKDNGAMLNARLQWNCRIDSGIGCKFPEIQLKRLDSGSGYQYYLPRYIRSPDMNFNEDIRILHRYSGLRFLVVSKGEGKKFSILATVLQFSSALALLGTANAATDFIMTKVLPERRHYLGYKEDVTPDFSDVREKLQEAKMRSAERQAAQKQFT